MPAPSRSSWPAGAGVRMGAEVPKALHPARRAPMVVWSVDALAASARVDGIVLVAPPRLEGDATAALGLAVDLLRVRAPRGRAAPRSVRAGLDATPADAERVLVHDAARPLMRPDLVEPGARRPRRRRRRDRRRAPWPTRSSGWTTTW